MLRLHKPEPKVKDGAKAMGASITLSLFFSFMFAGFLGANGIPLNVVLPTTAPVWMGTSTMLFMLLNG